MKRRKLTRGDKVFLGAIGQYSNGYRPASYTETEQRCKAYAARGLLREHDGRYFVVAPEDEVKP